LYFNNDYHSILHIETVYDEDKIFIETMKAIR